MFKSIRDFDVHPDQSAETNRDHLQSAIDWAAERGAAIYVEPSERPYPIAGGIVLRRNVSLVGVHGPVPRGTRHPHEPHPVGSVFAIDDPSEPFLTVEGATQVRGIQFWYPRQTRTDPSKIIPYPATIRTSQTTSAQGVTLSGLTFFGEYTAMDFNAPPKVVCELILIEHCYGYPLSGQFVRIDRCYDVPRVLHCHVNPATRRFIDGGPSRDVIDSVVARKTFSYTFDHTDNAQLIDLFTFGVWGGVYLGPATYGQLTAFNFDCVAVGIHKLGDNAFNRNWQIAQGSIIANTGANPDDVHPILLEGQGHAAISNVEAFSGKNDALTTIGRSKDFLQVRGDQKLTASLFGCRMRNYTADEPVTLANPNATVQAVACFDREGRPLNTTWGPH